jgi:hypothetical protein
VPLAWDNARLASLLALDDEARRRLVAATATAVEVVAAAAPAVVEAFLAQLG